MLVRLKLLLAAGALVLALAAPSAHAQQAPTLGAPETAPTTAAPAPDTSGSDGGGLETWQEALIFGAGLVLLLGIGFAIVGDARDTASRLTRRRGRGAEPEPAGAGHKHRQQSKQRARAKARAAKAQRRKNR